jgi:hypothetical protein
MEEVEQEEVVDEGIHIAVDNITSMARQLPRQLAAVAARPAPAAQVGAETAAQARPESPPTCAATLVLRKWKKRVFQGLMRLLCGCQVGKSVCLWVTSPSTTVCSCNCECIII